MAVSYAAPLTNWFPSCRIPMKGAKPWHPIGGSKSKPIAGALGAEIASVDLGPWTMHVQGNKGRLLEHLVVFFRRQTITPEQQVVFARRFGEIHHHPFMKGMDAYPEILEIIKEEGDTRAFGEVWHTDQMFNPRPAKATISTPRRRRTRAANAICQFVPCLRGAIRSEKEMLEGITPSTSAIARGSSRTHEIGSTSDGRYVGNATMAAKVRDPGDLHTEAVHPLVRTHPETGRKVLYIRQSHANA